MNFWPDKSGKINRAELELFPKNIINIQEEDTARQILKMMETLEENEDINRFSSNFNIEDELLNKIM